MINAAGSLDFFVNAVTTRQRADVRGHRVGNRSHFRCDHDFGRACVYIGAIVT